MTQKSKEKTSYSRLIKSIARYYGLKKQLIKTTEETGEFSAAISRLVLNNGTFPLTKTPRWFNPMIEEMADVQVMIDQIVYLTKTGMQFNRIRRMKAERQIERIKSEKAKKRVLEETK